MGHYVALSVVGTERIPESPYLRAKNAQETQIKGGGIPYSIVQATQFFEFVKRIADEATVGTTVRLPPVLIQPMAADAVAKAVGDVAVGAPLNGLVTLRDSARSASRSGWGSPCSSSGDNARHIRPVAVS